MAVSNEALVLANTNYGALLLAMLPVGVELNALLAVLVVEASGQGIDPKTSKPVIRFEVHQFFERYGHLNQVAFDAHFMFDKLYKWKGHAFKVAQGTAFIPLHVPTGGQAAEWLALQTAMELDPSSAGPAIESTSFGAGQIMGFHYKRVGYDTPFDMMRAAYNQEEQIHMLIRLIESDIRLLTALRKKDWATFARYYNGTGQIPTYSKLLGEAYGFASSLTTK